MGSVAKDVVLNLGMITCTVRVESASYTEDFLTNVCVGYYAAEMHEPLAVKRPLTCDTCGPITMHGLRKAKKEAGGLVVLDESEVAGLKDDGAAFKGKIQLIPYDSSEVLANTGQGDKYYQLHPQTSPENYALLKQVIAAYPGKLFVARYAVRTKASLFVAQVKDGCILVQERTFVDNLKPVPGFDGVANEAFVPLAIQMVETMHTEFDQATFADTYNKNLVEITRDRTVLGGSVARTAPVDSKITADLVRNALMEYRARKMVDVAADV